MRVSRSSLKNINTMINNARNDAGEEKIFLTDFISFVETSNKPRNPSKFYKPSSLLCMRQMYYQRVGVDIEADRGEIQLIGMGEHGTDRHARLQAAIQDFCNNHPDYEWIDPEEYIKENNIKYLEVVGRRGDEVKCFHTVLNMSFMCDGILKIRGEYYILEIKTESMFKYNKRDDVAEEHKTQASCYSLAFNINKILFLYECRDTLEKKTFPLNVTEKMQENLVINRINSCDTYVQNLTPPPKNEIKKVCQYCKYTRRCRKDG